MIITDSHKNLIRTIIYSWRFPRDIFFSYLKLGFWHSSWRLYGLPLIQRHRSAKIIIGKKWISCSNPRYNSLGVSQKVILKATRAGATILIGNDVGMSGVTISSTVSVIIGDETLIGSGVLITDSDAHGINPNYRNNSKYIQSEPVLIGNRVFIGARSIILKGVTIGDGAVVGAGSIVSKNIPPMAIAVGNPAKVIGDVREKKYLSQIK